MDLVSSTLDKYLKHRFSGARVNKSHIVGMENGGNKSDVANTMNGTKTSDNDKTSQDVGDEEEDNGLAPLGTVHHLSIERLRPSCVDIKEDFSFLAIGFDNSQIYIWKLSVIEPFESQTSDVPITADHTTLNETLHKTKIHNTTSTVIKSGTVSSSSEGPTRLLAHYGPVYSVKFIKNNDLMLSCSEDATIRLWCLKSKCNLAIYRGHSYPIWSLAIGPSEEYFASTSMDKTARLWRFDKITPLRIFCGHDEDVECVSFHPNSKYIATGSTDTTVRLWSTLDAKMVRLMIGHKNSISSLSFLPDGKHLASADTGGTVKIWNLATNTITNDISVPASHTISFSPGHDFICTCGKDNILQLWKVGKSGIIEKKRLSFDQDKSIRLISSHFVSNRLFVISHKGTKSQDGTMSSRDIIC